MASYWRTWGVGGFKDKYVVYWQDGCDRVTHVTVTRDRFPCSCESHERRVGAKKNHGKRAEIRREAKEGIEVDNFLVVVTFGTGVAFGERVGVVGFKPVRIVLRSLLIEEVLAFAAAESDAQVVDVDERVVDRESETRVDVSDGVASVRGSMLPTREQLEKQRFLHNLPFLYR